MIIENGKILKTNGAVLTHVFTKVRKVTRKEGKMGKM